MFRSFFILKDKKTLTKNFFTMKTKKINKIKYVTHIKFIKTFLQQLYNKKNCLNKLKLQQKQATETNKKTQQQANVYFQILYTKSHNFYYYGLQF